MSTNAKESAGKNIKYPWWYGGAAGIFATMVTHPLDLAKVRLQAAPMPKPTLFRMLESILANEGVVGLYSGLSAAVLRQCTYTTVRFGAYDLLKENVIPREQLTNMAYLLPCSMFSGAIGGLAGNFADVVVTYDVFKNYLVTKLDFDASKNYTHLTASLLAGLVATTVCSPADVMKTRIMNGSGDHQPALKILADAVRKEGPSFMFRGWLPSFTRLGPFTMLIFFAIEQLKKHRVGMPKEDK
ncbi:Mitochondrial dicarboxylate transporter [Saccharomyces cerevisiae]|nr:Mitochondrial dicarboxylate transporter [Saccharomyces cerevisiae]